MTLEDLGRRAVACKHWRFMDGMLTTCGLRVVDGGRDYVIGHRPGATRDGGGWYDGPSEGFLPDLSDPATLGCLLALVEEAWKCPVDMSFAGAHRLDSDAEERVYPQDHTVSFAAKTRVEALVAALEAAP
jgi:hypothetical protein